MTGNKFDVILMNPPYQMPSEDGIGRNKLLWPLFVEKSIEICKDEGYVAHIHPSIWRKPGQKLFKFISKFSIIHLRMYSKKSAKKIFGASTRFDWYLIKKELYNGKTLIIDEENNSCFLDISLLPFVPSSKINKVSSIMNFSGAKEDCLDVLFCTRYHSKYKELVLEESSDSHKYKLLHSITAKGPRFMFTNTKERGIFGVKNKVIINMGEKVYAFLDLDGSYGTTEGCFSIVCSSEEEARQVFKAVTSEKFQEEIIKSTKWSNFKIEYDMFSYFKKEFWKEFV